MSRFEIAIRKLAHFSLYFALGASVYLAFLELVYVRGWKYPGVCAFVFSTLYAAGDEIHQFFVPGRSMQLSDVLLDSAGVLTAIAVIYLIKKIVFMLREERKEHE